MVYYFLEYKSGSHNKHKNKNHINYGFYSCIGDSILLISNSVL